MGKKANTNDKHIEKTAADLVFDYGKALKLNDRQIKFALEYIIELNGTQAAINAGYGVKDGKENKAVAASQASRLLTNDKVAMFIQYLKATMFEDTKIRAERVLDELASIAFSRIDDYLTIETVEYINPITKEDSPYQTVKLFDFCDIPAHKLRAIESVKVLKHGAIELKLHNKVTTLVKLGEHVGVFAAEKDTPHTPIEVNFKISRPDQELIEGNKKRKNDDVQKQLKRMKKDGKTKT